MKENGYGDVFAAAEGCREAYEALKDLLQTIPSKDRDTLHLDSAIYNGEVFENVDALLKKYEKLLQMDFDDEWNKENRLV